MRFDLPRLPTSFEIPDDWWADAHTDGFHPSSEAYPSDATVMLFPLKDVQPPVRNPERPLDFGGFDRRRLVQVLQGMVASAAVPPVELRVLPVPTAEEFGTPNPYRYRVYDGYHRFYASVALGYTYLPGVIV